MQMKPEENDHIPHSLLTHQANQNIQNTHQDTQTQNFGRYSQGSNDKLINEQQIANSPMRMNDIETLTSNTPDIPPHIQEQIHNQEPLQTQNNQPQKYTQTDHQINNMNTPLNNQTIQNPDEPLSDSTFVQRPRGQEAPHYEHSRFENTSVELQRIEDALLEIKNLRIQNNQILDMLRRIEQKLI